MLENIAILVTPFAAFLLAESIHASGVLAVVVCGRLMSQLAPRVTGAVTRQQTTAFWSLATTAVVIGTRWAWLCTTPYLIRALDRRPSQRERRVSARQRTVSAATGFRGAVSLAAALAVPRQLSDGSPFPDRDLIVVVTSGVIVLTLLQALPLGALVRFARLPADTSVAEERHLAETPTTDAAHDAIDETAAELGTVDHVVDRAASHRLRRGPAAARRAARVAHLRDH